ALAAAARACVTAAARACVAAAATPAPAAVARARTETSERGRGQDAHGGLPGLRGQHRRILRATPPSAPSHLRATDRLSVTLPGREIPTSARRRAPTRRRRWSPPR